MFAYQETPLVDVQILVCEDQTRRLHMWLWLWLGPITASASSSCLSWCWWRRVGHSTRLPKRQKFVHVWPVNRPFTAKHAKKHDLECDSVLHSRPQCAKHSVSMHLHDPSVPSTRSACSYTTPVCQALGQHAVTRSTLVSPFKITKHRTQQPTSHSLNQNAALPSQTIE